MEQEDKTPEVEGEEATDGGDESEESGGEDTDLTVEDYRQLQERLKKAEKKLVEFKKAKKTSELKDSEDLIEAKLIERDFYRDNPEFKDYREEVSSYVKKWLSYDEAASLVKTKDPSFGNKDKAKSMSVAGGESGATKSVYTSAELVKMSQKEYNAVKALEIAGKVRITR